MTDDVRNLIRFVVDGDIRNAQTQCRIMLEKNVPEKDARFKEAELKKLNLLKPELIQLPANLESLLIAEDATNFPESRFLLREEEETVINKLLATRKAALAIKELGIHYTCSLLLTGLPGVGKTELARYIAHKANLPFVFLKFSGLVNSALGRTQQNIGRVFDYAKRTPCVLCVDEIDAIGMCRGSRDDVAEMSRVTIALMQELDRLPNDVILIGTTNRVDNLDEALIRRFTFKHRVKPLGDDDMKELCKKFLASADYPFTESELDELCHSLREQRVARRYRDGIDPLWHTPGWVYRSGADQILYYFRTTQLLYIFSRVDVWFYAEKLMRGGIHLDPGIRKPKMYSAENISERNGSTLFFANGLCVNAEQTYKALGAQKRVIKYQVESPDSDVPTFSFCPFKL